MPTWIALLRGINVGGKNKLPMAELKATLEALGGTGVQTYIQSGNVVFQSSQRSAGRLQAAIGEAIEASHGFRPQVLALTADQLDAAIDGNPYPEAAAEPKTLHAYFLASKPKSPDTERLARLQTPTERCRLVDRVFYLHTPDGFGRSKLAAGVERLLGVEATARNWRTVLKLAEMARSGR